VKRRIALLAGGVAVGAAEALPTDPAERRQAVHAEGRSVVDRMRANEED
jgi:hypothetical protein